MKSRTIIATFSGVLAVSLLVSIPIALFSKRDDSSRTKVESALAADFSDGDGDGDEDENQGLITPLDEIDPESDRSSRILQIAATAVAYEIVPCSANNNTCSPEESALKWMIEVDTYDSPHDDIMEERFVLATLYYSTGKANSNWYSSRDHCRWEGVSECSKKEDNDGRRLVDKNDNNEWTTIENDNENGAALKLRSKYKDKSRSTQSAPLQEGQGLLNGIDLQYKGLTGYIPSVLGRLKHLRLLNLSRNQLEGTIPPEIGNMASLRRLRLEDNKLVGNIPAELANLKQLKFLQIHTNGFVTTIPKEICQLGVNFLMADCNVCPDDDGDGDCCNQCARLFTQPPTPSPSTAAYGNNKATCSRTSFERMDITSPAVEKLPISRFDEGTQRIQIGFDFHWLGGVGSTNEIVVDVNGQININPDNADKTCCLAKEIGTYENPRIAVVQEDLSPNYGGDIYIEKKCNSIVISWEDVQFFSYGYSDYYANAQAELFKDGSVQLCYGEGRLYYDDSCGATREMTAGIEAGVNDPLFPNGPALNYPLFGKKGLTKRWPGGECFCFNPTSRKWSN